MFVEFEKEVANESQYKPTEARRRSLTLIKHMFQECCADTMKKIGDIPFIPTAELTDALNKWLPSYQEGNYVCFGCSFPTSCEKLVWTKAPIIPDWAHPHTSFLIDDSKRIKLKEPWMLVKLK